LRRKLLLLAAASMVVGAFAFACDDDDSTDVVDEVQTQIGDAATTITGRVTAITDEETPEAGGAERTSEPVCPTPEEGETPEPDATAPPGCPQPSATPTPGGE
jgi:hypothetical protein